MMPHEPDDSGGDRLPGEEEIARTYRYAAGEAPPPALDAKILAAARSRRGAWARRWAVPFSVAAMIVLTVGVVLRVGVFDPSTSLPTESAPAAPAAPGDAGGRKESRALTEDLTPSRQGAPATDDRMTDKAAKISPRVARQAEQREDAPRPAAPPALEESAPRERALQAPAAGLAARSLAPPVAGGAHVEAVDVTGEPGAYRFTVRIRSADRGCRQYADWWEVVSLDGELLYRRVLAHSHVEEQPFVRAGGPVPIQPDTVVWVRAHMNTGGYGGTAFKGSPKTGFRPAALPADFAAALAQQPPLPEGCAF